MVPGGGAALIGSAPWRIERRFGDAGLLHEFEPPAEAVPTLVRADVTRPALVLGSSQPEAVVDRAAAALAGLDVVRRRSGGGAVLLVPGEHVWVDVWVPAGDDLWREDLVAAALPVGEAWASVLADLGLACTVHRGGATRGRIETMVCFAGRGPGEVSDSRGRKVVGVSQRRTRAWTRLQTLVHRQWDPSRTVAGLALADDDRERVAAEIAERVAAVAVEPGRVVAGLASALSFAS